MRAKFINEDAVLLRILTPKSYLRVGKYKDLRIQEILDLNKTAYLRYFYYNMQGISFTEDILKQIGVIGDDYDYRIKKPGTDHELGEKVFNDKLKNYPAAAWRNVKGARMGTEISNVNLDKRKFSKTNMRAFNQGKK
jgi:hypothetical protein